MSEEKQFRPGGRGWLSIKDGKFYAEYPFGATPNPDTILSDDPEKIRQFFTYWDVDSVSCSSSIDFPDEYGMSEEKVRQLFGESL